MIRRKKELNIHPPLSLVADIEWFIYICEMCILKAIYFTILGCQIIEYVSPYAFKIHALTLDT